MMKITPTRRSARTRLFFFVCGALSRPDVGVLSSRGGAPPLVIEPSMRPDLVGGEWMGTENQHNRSGEKSGPVEGGGGARQGIKIRHSSRGGRGDSDITGGSTGRGGRKGHTRGMEY